MKISEILKGVITVLKYTVVFYFIINLVAFIYLYMSFPRGDPMAGKLNAAMVMLVMGNAFLYGILSNIIQGKGTSTVWKGLYNDETY